jgi:hypothetical protein
VKEHLGFGKDKKRNATFTKIQQTKAISLIVDKMGLFT